MNGVKAWAILLAAGLCGCVAYPRGYWTVKEGTANVEDGSMCRVRAASVLLPEGDSWIAATEKARQSDAGVPIAWVPFAQ